MLVFANLVGSEEEKDKLEKIYRKYKKLMYYIANDILNNEHDAEDVVQVSVIKIAEYIEKINDINSNKTKHLIVTIVKSTSIDLYRKKKNTFAVDIDELIDTEESDEDSLEDLIVQLAEARELAGKVSQLKSEYGDILTLRYYHGFSNKEIAHILNITNENVRIRLYRARNSLKKIIIADSLKE